MAAYRRLVAEAEADYSGYWSRLAREFVSWKTPFHEGLDDSQAPFFKWFEDGTLNVSYNCLDRHVERGLGDKVAIIFEADDGAGDPRQLSRSAGPGVANSRMPCARAA
jgi:acetyl-CoA synthetase